MFIFIAILLERLHMLIAGRKRSCQSLLASCDLLRAVSEITLAHADTMATFRMLVIVLHTLKWIMLSRSARCERLSLTISNIECKDRSTLK